MANSHTVTGGYFDKYDPVSGTVHYMVQYQTLFEDGTRVAILSATIGGTNKQVILPFDSSTPYPKRFTTTQDMGEFPAPSSYSFVPVHLTATYVPGSGIGSDDVDQTVWFSPLSTGTYWSQLGSGFTSSWAPYVRVGVGVFIVLVACFTVPGLIRRYVRQYSRP